jgi:hypothetical protein
MKYFSKPHTEDYAVLGVFLGLGFLGIVVFQSQVLTQLYISLGLVILYVIWGILHHAFRKDLTRFIVLEYLLVAGFAGIALMAMVLNR